MKALLLIASLAALALAADYVRVQTHYKDSMLLFVFCFFQTFFYPTELIF